MPRVYRSMYPNGDHPQVKRSRDALGVLVGPVGPNGDIEPDPQGQVCSEQGGMSVFSAIRYLPYFLIPVRLKGHYPKAKGDDARVCWRLGEGDFLPAPVAQHLNLRPDKKKRHGLIEPECMMHIDEYERALQATREQWIKDED